MSRNTNQDKQGYIVGQYKAVEKVGHEYINRTGTKAILFLGREGEEDERGEETEPLDEVMKADLDAYVKEKQDADRPWRGVRDFLQKDMTLKTGASADTRAPSLARFIENADVDNADSDLDSDSEDDEIGLSQKIERAISSFAKRIEEYENDMEDRTTMITTNNHNAHRSPLLSPLEAIDIPYPCKPKQNSGLRRHSGGRSFAFLIAHAGDISSSRDEDERSPSRSLSLFPSPSSSPFCHPTQVPGACRLTTHWTCCASASGWYTMLVMVRVATFGIG
jgi:hypothetical protein